MDDTQSTALLDPVFKQNQATIESLKSEMQRSIDDYWSEMKVRIKKIQTFRDLDGGTPDQAKTRLLKKTWIKYRPQIKETRHPWGTDVTIIWKYDTFRQFATPKGSRSFGKDLRKKKSSSRYYPSSYPLDKFQLDPLANWQLEIIDKYESIFRLLRNSSFFLNQTQNQLHKIKGQMVKQSFFNSGPNEVVADNGLRQDTETQKDPFNTLKKALDLVNDDPNKLTGEPLKILLEATEDQLTDNGIDPVIQHLYMGDLINE